MLKKPVVQSAEENQTGAMPGDLLEQTLIKALGPLMNPSNGYDGVTTGDLKAMLYDNKDRAKYSTNPGAYEQEIARISAAQEAISRGDPGVFDGSLEGPFGYYAQDHEGLPGNRTGMVQVGPGAEGWNPNRAQANLLVLRTLIEEGYKAGLAAREQSAKKPTVQSASDNQRGK